VVDRVTGAGTPSGGGWDDFGGPSDLFFATIVAVILIPFGALGGWVLWRAGVRPAQPKPIDVAPCSTEARHSVRSAGVVDWGRAA
jgi:hypothetical protein